MLLKGFLLSVMNSESLLLKCVSPNMNFAVLS
jgi:hypothetical protein